MLEIDQFFLLLFILRSGVTQGLAPFLFGISVPTTSRYTTIEERERERERESEREKEEEEREREKEKGRERERDRERGKRER